MNFLGLDVNWLDCRAMLTIAATFHFLSFVVCFVNEWRQPKLLESKNKIRGHYSRGLIALHIPPKGLV